ncbi:TPA: hypothetical protein HA246_00390 [Candidatus Woesearchaeota archaeon]|nr:hypothetical protein [Candidatus Woesearchaeota archaeon]
MADIIGDNIELVPVRYLRDFPLGFLKDGIEIELFEGRPPKGYVLIKKTDQDLAPQQAPVMDDNTLTQLTHVAGFDNPDTKANAKAALEEHLVDVLTANAKFDDPNVEALVTASKPYRSPTIMDPFILYDAIKEMRKQYGNKANCTDSQLSDAIVPRQDILTADDYAIALADTIYVAKGFLSLAKFPLMKEIIDKEKKTKIDDSAEDFLMDGALILAKKLFELAAVSFDFQIAATGCKTESHFSNLGTVYERFRGELERTVLDLRAYIGPGKQADFDKHLKIYSDN